MTVESVIGRLDGVLAVKADAVGGVVRVEYDPTRITPDRMVETINSQTFYKARLPDLNTTPATFDAPAPANPAADQGGAIFEEVEGTHAAEGASDPLTVQPDLGSAPNEAPASRIDGQTSPAAVPVADDPLDPAPASSTLDGPILARYGIWGLVAIVLLGGGWWLVRVRLRRPSFGPPRDRSRAQT